MPNVRKIWHLQAQSAQHQRIVNRGIANFFAILLQYNSKIFYNSSRLEVRMLSSFGLEMPNFPYIWHLQSPVRML